MKRREREQIRPDALWLGGPAGVRRTLNSAMDWLQETGSILRACPARPVGHSLWQSRVFPKIHNHPDLTGRQLP